MDEETKPEYLYAYEYIAVEGRRPLTVISGYAQLLLRGLLGPLTNEQREILEVISSHAVLARAILNQGEAYFLSAYHPIQLDTISIAELERDIEHVILEDQLTCVFTTTNSVKETTLVMHSRLLARATTYLASTSYAAQDNTKQGTIIIEQNDSIVTFSITSRDVFLQENLDWHMNVPGSPWNIARKIVEQHGSHLNTRIVEGHYFFSFTLPIADQPTSS